MSKFSYCLGPLQIFQCRFQSSCFSKREFLIRWKNKPQSQPTWISQQQLLRNHKQEIESYFCQKRPTAFDRRAIVVGEEEEEQRGQGEQGKTESKGSVSRGSNSRGSSRGSASASSSSRFGFLKMPKSRAKKKKSSSRKRSKKSGKSREVKKEEELQELEEFDKGSSQKRNFNSSMESISHQKVQEKSQQNISKSQQQQSKLNQQNHKQSSQTSHHHRGPNPYSQPSPPSFILPTPLLQPTHNLPPTTTFQPLLPEPSHLDISYIKISQVRWNRFKDVFVWLCISDDETIILTEEQVLEKYPKALLSYYRKAALTASPLLYDDTLTDL